MELIKGVRGTKDIYAKARPGYHYVAQNSLDELVGTK